MKPADALLPRRPARELCFLRNEKVFFFSSSEEIKATRTNSHATSRARQGPPISFRKQYFPPPSTLSVVKQLIDSGATLIYDSSARKADPPATSAFPIVTLNERMESLKGSETMLTGRQISSNLDEDDYATITPQIRPVRDCLSLHFFLLILDDLGSERQRRQRQRPIRSVDRSTDRERRRGILRCF